MNVISQQPSIQQAYRETSIKTSKQEISVESLTSAIIDVLDGVCCRSFSLWLRRNRMKAKSPSSKNIAHSSEEWDYNLISAYAILMAAAAILLGIFIPILAALLEISLQSSNTMR
jgi:hypothetical protein